MSSILNYDVPTQGPNWFHFQLALPSFNCYVDGLKVELKEINEMDCFGEVELKKTVLNERGVEVVKKCGVIRIRKPIENEIVILINNVELTVAQRDFMKKFSSWKVDLKGSNIKIIFDKTDNIVYYRGKNIGTMSSNKFNFNKEGNAFEIKIESGIAKLWMNGALMPRFVPKRG